MVTILDLGLLQPFDFVFAFIFIWTITFALFQKTKFTGGGKGIDAMIAFAISFIILISETAVDMINFMIPWFSVAIIFFMLLMLIFMVFGASEKDIFAYVKNDKGVGWALIGVALVIVIAAFGNVLGQKFTQQAFEEPTIVEGVSGDTTTASFEGNITAIFSHPKVLGLLILFAIAIFTVGLLSGDF